MTLLTGAPDVAAAALTAFEGRDCDVLLLDGDGQPQLGFSGRLTGASEVDERGEVVALGFVEVGGGRHAGAVTLTEHASVEWRDVAMLVTAGSPDPPTPVRALVIDVGDGREVAIWPL